MKVRRGSFQRGGSLEPLERVVVRHAWVALVGTYRDPPHGVCVAAIGRFKVPIELLPVLSRVGKPATELVQLAGRSRQRRVELLRVPPHPARRGERDAVARVRDVREDLKREVLGDFVERHARIWARGAAARARESAKRTSLLPDRSFHSQQQADWQTGSGSTL
eukprot:30910-Pelagococcus_subviridis.AAC.13